MNKIKEFRETAELTVRELSEKSGVAVGYISTLENDGTGETNPSRDTMMKIAHALGKSVSEIFFPNEKEAE